MLPKQLKYGSKVESAAAKSSRVNIAPQNGTGPYNLGDTLVFNIPTRQNLVMCTSESYLRFTLGAITASAAAAVRWDSCGAHGIIQRIRIFHGSNLLQDIDNYSLLTKMLFDIQVPTDATYGKLNVLAGTRNDLVVATPTITTVDATDADKTQALANAIKTSMNLSKLQAVQINSGALILGVNNATTLANGALTAGPTDGLKANVYCLNLNCLLGTLCSQNYFPNFACTSAPLRMEITLVDNIVKCLNIVGGGSFASGAIHNVEYVANFIELGDSAMQTVVNSLQGQPLQFVVPDYRNYQFSYSLPASVGGSAVSTQVSMAIPAKFSSLKSLFVAFRDNGTGATAAFPFSSVTNGLSDYQFRIGSSIFPPKPPSTYPEMFAEVVKAIGSMSDLNYQPSIDKTSYTMSASSLNTVALETHGGSNVSSGSFYVGIDLENYVNAPKDNCFMGWNSNTDDIFFIGNFNNLIASVVNVRFDAYAMYDSCIVFENGTAYCRY